jgi:hypothetical protein
LDAGIDKFRSEKMSNGKVPAHIASLAETAPLPKTYDNAKRAIAECERMDECADWADKAAAIASYARQADDFELESSARRIRARAVRRCGELLSAFDARGGDRSKVVTPLDSARRSRAAVAKEAGLTAHKAGLAVTIANIPEAEFEAVVESKRAPGTTLLANLGKRHAPERVRSVTKESLTAVLKSEAAGRAVEGLLLFEKCATECGMQPIVEIVLRRRGCSDRAKRGIALAFQLNRALDQAGGRGNPMLRRALESRRHHQPDDRAGAYFRRMDRFGLAGLRYQRDGNAASDGRGTEVWPPLCPVHPGRRRRRG